MVENVKKRRKTNSYGESLKLEVLRELSLGGFTFKELSNKYGIPSSTISTWSRTVRNDVKEPTTSIKERVYMGEEDQKIRDLESALADSLLKNKLYEKMFEYAKEDYGIEIKKNTATGQYSLTRKNTGSGGSVKS